ncbi:MAG: hypothetical protein HY741_26330 [Chloroflexi bacterium]|nr:hypothetical protein [Chloroflexota bacterium]
MVAQPEWARTSRRPYADTTNQLGICSSPADFGSGGSAVDLAIDGNEALQREIAFHFVFQSLNPVKAGQLSGTPNEMLDMLTQVLTPGPSETYTIGFYKRDGTGGHAVTPFAVQDRGSGQFAVLIYDNNYPKETKEILFDRNANTWSYNASINPTVPPEIYEGDADTKSLLLFPTSPGLTVRQAYLPCPVCRNGGRAAGNAAPTAEYNQIFLDGNPVHHAHLLITDENGKRYGYLPDGMFVTEIPGVQVQRTFLGGTGAMGPEPTYLVPIGLEFSVTIDGAPLQEPDSTDLVMIGPGYYIGVEDINLDPGQKDELTLAPDGSALSYKTVSSESPNLILGVQGEKVDFAFLVKGMDVEGGGTLTVALDKEKGALGLSSLGTEKPGVYGLLMERIDEDGGQTFYHDGIALTPEDVAYVDYSHWQGNNTALELEIDRKGDDTIDETEELTDAQPASSVPKPPAPTGAKPLAGAPEWDELSQALAQSLGFEHSAYEAWELPPTTKWEDTYKYYGAQMEQLGWTGEGVEFDFWGSEVGAWVDPVTNTGLVVLFVPSPDGIKPAYALAIFGLMTPAPQAQKEFKPVKTAETDQL